MTTDTFWLTARHNEGLLLSTTEAQLEAVYHAIYIGMDVLNAMFISEISDADIEVLDNAPDFAVRVRFWQQKAIYDVLDAQHIAMNRNLSTGTSVESRWLLAHLDRKRFGNGPIEVGGSDDLPPINYTEKK
jgi:hypothetical protein